jgi:hypothetical protein
MPQPTPSELRELILEIAMARRPRHPTDAALQSITIFQALAERFPQGLSEGAQRSVLTVWNDLFRTGYFAWGGNLNNPSPPFFIITERGDIAMERLSRDPGNPGGYIRHLRSVARLNDVADSYLVEGLSCYVGGLFKAAAVMLGAAAESMVLEIRDIALGRLGVIGRGAPPVLSDWRIKTVLDGLAALLGASRSAMPHELREEFDAYFLSIAQTIRAARNDAGHPTSVAPVTEDSVHASFLLFSTLAAHFTKMRDWIHASLP